MCIATNADLRYERLKNRPIRPHTLEESIMRDYSEIENIEKGGPIAIADCYICNNGEIEPFVNEVNNYINSLKK